MTIWLVFFCSLPLTVKLEARSTVRPRILLPTRNSAKRWPACCIGQHSCGHLFELCVCSWAKLRRSSRPASAFFPNVLCNGAILFNTSPWMPPSETSSVISDASQKSPNRARPLTCPSFSPILGITLYNQIAEWGAEGDSDGATKGIYADRVAGGDCHYRHLGRPAFAGSAENT